MSHKIVDLATGASGAGATGAPFNQTQFIDSIGLTGVTGDHFIYQVEGMGYFTGEVLAVRRDKCTIQSVEKTPARLFFMSTGDNEFVIENQCFGNTAEQHVTLDRLMIQKTGLNVDNKEHYGAITIVNNGTTSSATNTRLTVTNCYIRSQLLAGTGELIRDKSTGDGHTTLDLRYNDFMAFGNKISHGIYAGAKEPSNVMLDSCHFEGYMTPIRRNATGAGSYHNCSFYETMRVKYKNDALIPFTWVVGNHTVQFASDINLASVSVGDQFIDSSLVRHYITQVWDGLDRIEVNAASVADAVPTEFRQGSIVTNYPYISVGIGNTGEGTGASGAVAEGLNNRDHRFLPHTLGATANSIDTITFPMGLEPSSTSDLIGHGSTGVGVYVDILNEPRTSYDIGCKEYHQALNNFDIIPRRIGTDLVSTIDKNAVIAMSDADTYFDNITKLAKVEIWYKHEDGRQEKYILHQGSQGGPLTAHVTWTIDARAGIWHKDRMKLTGWNGETTTLRGRVQRGRLEDIILQ